MSYKQEENQIYPVYDLMSQGLSSINELIIEHMRGKINNEVIILFEKRKYSEAFKLIDNLGLSEIFDREYFEWYQENEDNVIITICDCDCYYLKEYN